MKKDTWLIILGVVVVIIIILVVVFYKPGSQTTLAPTATPGIGNTSPTKGEVPKDAKVYEVGETFCRIVFIGEKSIELEKIETELKSLA